MKIAFDVKGTIDGPNQDKVLRLFRALQQQGHEMVVWSSRYSYATGAVAKHSLSAEALPKTDKWGEVAESDYMDIAIDDEPQTWLTAKRLILVRDLPADVEAFAAALTAEHGAMVSGPQSGGANA